MYIKTKKNLIYKVANIYHDYRDRPLYEIQNGLNYLMLDSDEIRETAETIEELCDEFVILPLDQNKRPLHHFLRTPIIDDISHFINDSHIIYGAIWTDKGLTYVAKMNEKGELELL